jgi:hypothetical protein
MEEYSEIERRIAEIETELADLDQRRNQLLGILASLREQSHQAALPPNQLSLHLRETPVNHQSPQEDKIRLFRSLFKGRVDVFHADLKTLKLGNLVTHQLIAMKEYRTFIRNQTSHARNAIICH